MRKLEKLTLADLLVDPCKLCRSKRLNDRSCKPADDFYSCGVYWEILFEKWDETRDLIRKRAGKRE